MKRVSSRAVKINLMMNEIKDDQFISFKVVLMNFEIFIYCSLFLKKYHILSDSGFLVIKLKGKQIICNVFKNSSITNKGLILFLLKLCSKYKITLFIFV